MDDSGTAKITDFSLSKIKILSAYTTGYHFYGTMSWTAPELLKNDFRKQDHSSDVYAFGITSYEIVSHGEMSFIEIINTGDVVRAVCDGVRPGPKPDHCSNSVWQLIELCWHQDPEKRPSFQSIQHKIKVIHYSV